MTSTDTDVERHRTALTRVALSRPVDRAVRDGLITRETSVLDFGCGRGGDVDRLNRIGIQCTGYDPIFRPATELPPSDVVNLGYVVNVIEDPQERERTLRRAWSLARRVLVVAARTEAEAEGVAGTTYGDGLLTTNQTFQKFYTQDALRLWIERTLERAPVAGAPGVFYIFRDPAIEQTFLLNRVRRVISRTTVSKELFDQNHELLIDLMSFIEEHGRLPRTGEWGGEHEVKVTLGSLKHAFLVIRRSTGDERWDRARMSRSEDLLVFLALGRFGRRPRFGQLPQALRDDIRDLFGSYKAACAQGDRLLFAVAETDRVRAAARASTVGKSTPDALYVHVSALGALAPILRVREGCARALLGTVEEATLIKFHLDRPIISYLDYPRFDTDAHPALHSGYVVRLDSLRADFRDYRAHDNPPILHRKELFLCVDHPLRERFARLTRQEIKAGLYGTPEQIGTRKGWEEHLALRGVRIAGHRLTRARAGTRS
jgi:DNA phosphorothioation-associated putative methyltransferase